MVSPTQEHWTVMGVGGGGNATPPPLHIKGPTHEGERGASGPPAERDKEPRQQNASPVTHGYLRPAETQTVTHA